VLGPLTVANDHIVGTILVGLCVTFVWKLSFHKLFGNYLYACVTAMTMSVIMDPSSKNHDCQMFWKHIDQPQ